MAVTAPLLNLWKNRNCHFLEINDIDSDFTWASPIHVSIGYSAVQSKLNNTHNTQYVTKQFACYATMCVNVGLKIVL